MGNKYHCEYFECREDCQQDCEYKYIHYCKVKGDTIYQYLGCNACNYQSIKDDKKFVQ